MTEPPHTDDELAQAEALARALDAEETHGPKAIDDALEVAQLVRARGAALLADERAQALLDEVEQRLKRKRQRRVLWMAGGGAFAMVAAALLIFWSAKLETRLEPARPAAATRASGEAGSAIRVGLAEAAAFAATQRAYLDAPNATAQSTLDAALVRYRDAQLATLEVRYR